MRWGRKSKKMPSGAIRERPTASDGPPVYSYYARGTGKQERPDASARALTGDRHRTEHRQRLHRYITFLCCLCACICVGKMVALVPSSKVVVTHNTHGLQLPTDVYAKTADELLRKSLLNRTKITLNTNGIATYLQREHPELESVVVAVPLMGNNPLVYVTPAQPSIVVDAPSGLYTIDTKGHVLARVTDDKGMVRLRDGGHTLTLGAQYTAPSTVAFASTVAYQLERAGYPVKYLEIPVGKPYELVAHIDGAPLYIRFNLQADGLQQSGGAVAVLKKSGQPPHEYIDVRVPGRVYYR